MKPRSAIAALSFATAIGLLAPGPSAAAPVVWADNGNGYEVVVGTFSWEQASIAAAGSTWLGVNGHLVTITSSDENLFVSSLSPDLAGYAVGGLQGPGGGTPGEAWQWVTGEAFVYTNWNSGEPNDEDGLESAHEDRLYLIAATNAHGNTWNDESGNNSNGYIVEYEGIGAIPEPETYVLLLAGLGLLGFAARRRAR